MKMSYEVRKVFEVLLQDIENTFGRELLLDHKIGRAKGFLDALLAAKLIDDEQRKFYDFEITQADQQNIKNHNDFYNS